MQTVFKSPIFWGIVALIVSIGLFMSVNVSDWQFALSLRGKKVLTLMTVGFAVGTSTLLFQTLTHNPILTPSLLGFDALYVLIKSLMVFFLGVVGMVALPDLVVFAFEIAIMMGVSLLMFGLLFTKRNQDLTRLILVGVVLGVLFRSLSSLVARLISPDDFVVIQAVSFANFNTINLTLLVVSMVICVVCAVVMYQVRYACDILLLGRNYAINLGIDYTRLAKKLLVVIATLVSVSTALVGPVTFFGLLVCALTNQLSVRMHHASRLLLVSVVSMTTLVAGQLVFEQFLGMAGVLSVVIELFGGVAFLWLVLRQVAKQKLLTQR